MVTAYILEAYSGRGESRVSRLAVVSNALVSLKLANNLTVTISLCRDLRAEIVMYSSFSVWLAFFYRCTVISWQHIRE